MKFQPKLIPISIGGALIAFIGLSLFFGFGGSPEAGEDTHEAGHSSQSSQLPGTVNCMVKLPATIEFCGEAVPIHENEIRERLDREMHVNSYWHSSTMQKLKLANRWFPVIEPILQQHGLPDDLKYIVVAESGFMNVRSHAGAQGFWQFMPKTAKEYGLTVTSEVDERYHVEKATDAACRYMKRSFAKLGNWTTACAGYNAGFSGISRRLTEQQVDNYYDLYLNQETARYVFRLIAFKLIMENPTDFGFCFDQNDLYQPLTTKTIIVNEPIPNLATWAKANGTNLKNIKYLNPWLRGKTLLNKANKQYEIKV